MFTIFVLISILRSTRYDDSDVAIRSTLDNEHQHQQIYRIEYRKIQQSLCLAGIRCMHCDVCVTLVCHRRPQYLGPDSYLPRVIGQRFIGLPQGGVLRRRNWRVVLATVSHWISMPTKSSYSTVSTLELRQTFAGYIGFSANRVRPRIRRSIFTSMYSRVLIYNQFVCELSNPSVFNKNNLFLELH